MDSLLLHTCCGPCSTVAVPFWRAEGLEPLALFANPNIQPDVELARRTVAMRRYAQAAGVELVVDPVAGGVEWTAAVVPLAVASASGPRGGDQAVGASPGPARDRCRACLQVRMTEAAFGAAARGLPLFSTSLSVSPWQHHDLIAQAGYEAAALADVEFVYADLRRWYRRSIDESRRLELYRQPYCGCVASKWEAWYERRARRAARAHRQPAA